MPRGAVAQFGEEQVITNEVDDAESVYAADLDGDGDMDVLSASSGDDKIAWYENDGTGSFSEEQVISTEDNISRLAYAADLSGSGDLDVISNSSEFNFEFGTIMWYENNGTGSFGEEQVITSDIHWATSVHVADLDGDGDLDVLSNSSDLEAEKRTKIAWYENDGTGGFGEEQVINEEQDI